ncbi:MAG: hypothetical protein MJ252_01385 [archaeon]|nr:hypothetical protein [archaeon]
MSSNSHQKNKSDPNIYDQENMNMNYNPNQTGQIISDERLAIVLVTLGLEDLVSLFEDNAITFVDLLLLSKKDLMEFQLDLYQRNRIWNFCSSYKRVAKSYTSEEIIEFFKGHRHYVFNDGIVDGEMGSQINNQNLNNSKNNPKTNISSNSGNMNNGPGKKMTLSTSKEKVNEGYQMNYPQNYQSYQGNNPKYKGNQYPMENNIQKQNQNPNQGLNYCGKDEIHMQDLETPNVNQKVKKTNKNKFTPGASQSQNVGSRPYQLNNSNNYSSNNSRFGQSYSQYNPYGSKSFKSSSDAYSKYLSVKQDADNMIEKLNKMKNDDNKHKYQCLVEKVKKDGKAGRVNQGQNYNPYSYSGNKNYYQPNEEEEMEQQGQMYMDDQRHGGSKIEEHGQNQPQDNLNPEEVENIFRQVESKIDKANRMKLDYCSSRYMEQLKKFLQDKGDNLTVNDLNKVNKELDKFFNLIDRKAALEKNLNEYKISIEDKKRRLAEIERGNIDEALINNGEEGYYEEEEQRQGDAVEELEEEYEQDSGDGEGKLRDHSA